jgi:hypothetical protein
MSGNGWMIRLHRVRTIAINLSNHQCMQTGMSSNATDSGWVEVAQY